MAGIPMSDELEIEMKKRRTAINSTVASFALEGVHATPAALALAERYINLEIDDQQLVELAEKLAIGQKSVTPGMAKT